MYKRLVINTLCDYYVPYVPMCFKKNDLFIIYSLLKNQPCFCANSAIKSAKNFTLLIGIAL
jgi:hypothetical protein